METELEFMYMYIRVCYKNKFYFFTKYLSSYLYFNLHIYKSDDYDYTEVTKCLFGILCRFSMAIILDLSR